MIKWLFCKLWGHDFYGSKILPITAVDPDGIKRIKGGNKECHRCGYYIRVAKV